MDQISCEICMDLLPLVQDGAASAESCAAVEGHLRSCAACRALARPAAPPPGGGQRAFGRLWRQLRLFGGLLMLLGLFWGSALVGGPQLFYNSLLMPAIGVLGYAVFRWQALWGLPVLLFAVQGLMELSRRLRGLEGWGMGLLFWPLLCSIFAAAGVAVAGLLQLAFQKKGGPQAAGPGAGGGKGRALRTGALLLALLIAAGLLQFANALLGNPISRLVVSRAAKSYLAEQYAGTGFVLEGVDYSFKSGCYCARAQLPGSTDRFFTLTFSGDGALREDRYDRMVAGGGNTALRLQEGYRRLTGAVFESPSFPLKAEIAFGELAFVPEKGEQQEGSLAASVLVEAELTPDGIYDLPALGARAGLLTLYLTEDALTAQRAAERLLQLKALMQQGGAPFYAVDLVLRRPARPGGTAAGPAEQLELRQFLWSDIYAEGLTARVERSIAETQAYYAAMEEEKSADLEDDLLEK